MEPKVNDPVAHSAELSEAGRKVQQAAALMDEAAALLNSRSEPCRECGVAHYDSFEEYVQARDIRLAAEALRRRVGSLRKMSDDLLAADDSRAV